MAMARPVVATDIGPSAEILGPDAGVLVAPEAAAMAAAIESLLQRPEQRAALGRAGRQRATACFGLERQLAAMTTVYREAIGRG
jgi:glycosyltransferase involved in cell wall biosynthesis